MKKYIKPVMEGELFVANEYIGACGDHEYRIKCDVPGTGSLYKESNGIDGLQRERQWVQTGTHWWQGYFKEADEFLDYGEACGTWHNAVLDFDPTDPENKNGYWYTNGTTIEVFVFNEKGKGTSDWHGSIGCSDNIVNAS